MSAEAPAYLLEWDPSRVWDADFNIWLDKSQYGAVWSAASTTIPAAGREIGRHVFHGMHTVVADDDYPANDLGWSIVSQAMLDVLVGVGDFAHEAIPVDVLDAGANATTPPPNDSRFFMLHLPEHLDGVLDLSATIAKPVPGMDGMLTAPTAFVFDSEAIAKKPLPPIFRLAAYPWGPVVSAAAKAALEKAGIRSLRFLPATALPEAHFRTQLLDPWALDRMVADTKPEQGLDRLFAISRSPSCDRATALRLYWMHGPAYFQQFADQSEIPAARRGIRKLLDAVQRRYTAGMYRLRLLYFNPQDDDGYDWTVRFAEPGRAEHFIIPAIMQEAVGEKPTTALSPQQRLFRVVAAGDRRAAQELVMSDEVDLEAADDDEYGDTALHLAVRHLHREIVDLLVFQGADLNAQNRLRHSPLHVAAAAGAFEIVVALIEAGADVDALAHVDRPLQLAVRSGHVKVVTHLIEHGASLSDSGGRGSGSLLHDACAGRSTEVLELLLDRGGDTEVVDIRGDTPLKVACAVGWADGANVLVVRGADVSAEHAQTGQTALHVAASTNNVKVVRWLLGRGARRQQKDKLGQTPLDLALRSGGSEAAAALLDSDDADANAALEVAMSWEGADWEAVALLLAHGAQAERALRRAARFGFEEVVSHLLQGHSVDRASAGEGGETPLMLAAARLAGEADQPTRIRIVRAIGEAGAVNARDAAGATALHYAAAAGHEEVSAALLALGADAGLCTTAPFDGGQETPAAPGARPADVAAAIGNEALAALLTKAARKA